MPSLKQSHLQSVYRPVVVVFCSLAVLILGIALYSGSAGATISLTAVPQEVKTTVIITVGPKTGEEPLYLTGRVTAETLEESVTAKPSGEGTLVPAHARGRVTFHNETATAQPLAVGTRLRPIDGEIIVRTTARVDVPAGGTVQADVVADPLGETGNLEAGRFIIVALWPGLQESIYATSDKALTGGLASEAGGLGLDELTAASNAAEKTLREKFGTSVPGILKQLFPVEVTTIPPASEPSAEYTVTVTMKSLIVTYDTNKITSIISDHLQPLVPADQVLLTLEAPSLVIENQPKTDEVVITVKGKGQTQLTTASELLQPKQFIGLSRPDILARLTNDNVKDAAIQFSPPWRQTAPAQAERIRIVIRNTQ